MAMDTTQDFFCPSPSLSLLLNSLPDDDIDLESLFDSDTDLACVQQLPQEQQPLFTPSEAGRVGTLSADEAGNRKGYMHQQSCQTSHQLVQACPYLPAQPIAGPGGYADLEPQIPAMPMAAAACAEASVGSVACNQPAATGALQAGQGPSTAQLSLQRFIVPDATAGSSLLLQPSQLISSSSGGGRPQLRLPTLLPQAMVVEAGNTPHGRSAQPPAGTAAPAAADPAPGLWSRTGMADGSVFGPMVQDSVGASSLGAGSSVSSGDLFAVCLTPTAVSNWHMPSAVAPAPAHMAAAGAPAQGTFGPCPVPHSMPEGSAGLPGVGTVSCVAPAAVAGHDSHTHQPPQAMIQELRRFRTKVWMLTEAGQSIISPEPVGAYTAAEELATLLSGPVAHSDFTRMASMQQQAAGRAV